MPRILAPGMTLTSPLRTTTSLGGAPIIMPARIPVPTSGAGIFNGSGPGGVPPPLIAASEASTGGVIYTPYAAAAAEYAANYAALTSPLLAEYSTDPTGGLFARWSHGFHWQKRVWCLFFCSLNECIYIAPILQALRQPEPFHRLFNSYHRKSHLGAETQAHLYKPYFILYL